MKINFDGHYKEVARIINSQVTKPEEDRASFGKLLGEFEPKQPNPLENTQDLTSVKSALQLGDSSVMARYSFPEPSLDKPALEDGSGSGTPVKTPSAGVKAPTIVGARRIHDQTASISRDAMHRLVGTTGMAVGIDPALSLAVAKTESSFNPKAISSDGHASKGLFQLLDSTGKHLHSRLEEQAAYDPFNPTQNAKLGVEYLRYLHEIFSKETALPHERKTIPAANSSSLEKFAVAAFNAGEGRVASAQSRAKRAGLDPSEYHNIEQYLPEITQQYVQRVLTFRDQFGNAENDENGNS